MIKISDEYNEHFQGGEFTSPKKNLGNKLFIYSCCRIISNLMKYNLICPENALIRREKNYSGTYDNEVFPFGSIMGRDEIDLPIKTITDNDIKILGSIENLLNHYPNHSFISYSYYSKYEYIKPYMGMVREMYSSLIKEKRNDNSIVLMLRNSRDDGRFVLPDDYYINILEKENFDNVYVSLDHIHMHGTILKKLEKYNPTLIDGSILDVFKEITSFNTIVGAQGTFSFWACLLSNANKIYWPLTNEGPNSNNSQFGEHVNLIVDDDPRYEFIKINNIYQNNI
jgi:hypothetical protein